jgi:hypothetical protein
MSLNKLSTNEETVLKLNDELKRESRRKSGEGWKERTTAGEG